MDGINKFLEKKLFEAVDFSLAEFLFIASIAITVVLAAAWLYSQFILNPKITSLKEKDSDLDAKIDKVESDLKEDFKEHEKRVDRQVHEKFLQGIEQVTHAMELSQKTTDLLMEKFDTHITEEMEERKSANKFLGRISDRLGEIEGVLVHASMNRSHVKQAKLNIVLERLRGTAELTFNGAYKDCLKCDGKSCTYIESYRKIAAERILKSKEYWVEHNIPHELVDAVQYANGELLGKVTAVYLPYVVSTCQDEEFNDLEMETKRALIKKDIKSLVGTVSSELEQAILQKVVVDDD